MVGSALAAAVLGAALWGLINLINSKVNGGLPQGPGGRPGRNGNPAGP